MASVFRASTAKGSAGFSIQRFDFVLAANSRPLRSGGSKEKLSANFVRSGEVLKIGNWSFEIFVCWSCDEDGNKTSNSMVGIAIAPIGCAGTNNPLGQVTITLCARNGFFPVVRTFNSVNARSIPSPYACQREKDDGFELLSTVLSRHLLGKTDALTVKVDVELILSQGTVTAHGDEPTLQSQDVLGNRIGALLDSGRHADVTLTVRDESFRAHSLILTAHSPVFEAMLSHDVKEASERNVTIEELEPTAVWRMLEFMYKGKLDLNISDHDITELLHCANRYQLEVIVDACAVAIRSRLTEKVAVDYLLQADLLGIDSLKGACIRFIVSCSKRLAAVQRTESFAHLAKERPHLLVELLAAVGSS